ncbi:hypothetical protein [Persicitalea jodogahamensis]|uniref:hypothetical protein n=1 Tax=Persicitalea jodogahamensis TaxID=402147 RepID=UPI0016727440
MSYAEKCIRCQEMALRKSDSGKSTALSGLLGKALISLILSYYFANVLYKPNELFSFANTEKPKKYAFLTGSVVAGFFLALTVSSYFLQLDVAEAQYIMDLTKCLCD